MLFHVILTVYTFVLDNPLSVVPNVHLFRTERLVRLNRLCHLFVSYIKYLKVFRELFQEVVSVKSFYLNCTPTPLTKEALSFETNFSPLLLSLVVKGSLFTIFIDRRS